MCEWLEPEWQRLNRTRLQGRLPHALVISGADGVGKQRFAERLAHCLLCENPGDDGAACGRCSACGWLHVGSHPDLLTRTPEEPGKAIKVDQIRALCNELGMTSHAGRYKVAIIRPADAMNVNAANSLLKTLEEPTDSTLLMLLSAAPGKLPATVRSRCQRVHLRNPDAASAANWLESVGVDPTSVERYLQLARGAPLRALEMAQAGDSDLRDQRLAQLGAIYFGKLDPVQVAREWIDAQEQRSLEWWQEWLQDAIRWKIGGQPPAAAQVAQELRQILDSVDCRYLFVLLDKIGGALASIGSGLNRQLIMEDLLIGWANHTHNSQLSNHSGY